MLKTHHDLDNPWQNGLAAFMDGCLQNGIPNKNQGFITLGCKIAV
jgi:hypothetical protein